MASTQAVPFDFDGVLLSAIPHEEDLWLTSEDIGRALEYSEPRIAIQKLFNRNKEELERYSCITKLVTQAGENGAVDVSADPESTPGITTQRRSIRVFNEEGVMILTMLSSQPKAAAFRAWAVKILKAYRHGNLVLSNPASRDRLLETCIKEVRFNNPAAIHTLVTHFGYPETIRADAKRLTAGAYDSTKPPEAVEWFFGTLLPWLAEEVEAGEGELLAAFANPPPDRAYNGWKVIEWKDAAWCLRHRSGDLFAFVRHYAEKEGIDTELTPQTFGRWLAFSKPRFDAMGWQRIKHSGYKGEAMHLLAYFGRKEV